MDGTCGTCSTHGKDQGSLFGENRPGYEVDRLPLSSAEIKMSGVMPPLSLYYFMARKGATLPFSVAQKPTQAQPASNLRITHRTKLDAHTHANTLRLLSTSTLETPLPTQHTSNTRYEHRCHQWNSDTRSQLSSCLRSTPQITRSPVTPSLTFSFTCMVDTTWQTLLWTRG